MRNKQLLMLGVIAAIILVGVIAIFSFSEPASTVTNASVQTSDQGSSSQGSSDGSSGTNTKTTTNKKTTTQTTTTSPSGPALKDCTVCGGDGKVGAYMCNVCGFYQTVNTGICPICASQHRNSQMIFHANYLPCNTCGADGKVNA